MIFELFGFKVPGRKKFLRFPKELTLTWSLKAHSDQGESLAKQVPFIDQKAQYCLLHTRLWHNIHTQGPGSNPLRYSLVEKK